MQKTHSATGPNNIPRPKIERALREAAANIGGTLPETEEELDAAEERLADRDRSIPPVSKLNAFIDKGEADRVVVVALRNEIDDETTQELAAAARNGKQIPNDVRLRMDSDRACAESEPPRLL